jgi:hypothetical protein
MPRVAVQDMTSSLSLRATTSIVDCGTDCIGTGDVTVMGWVKAYSLGSSSAGRIITNGVFYVYMFANNVYRVSSNGGGTVAVTANEAMPKGKWHHLAVTRTASGVVNIRVNSSISGSPNQPSGTPSAAITNMFIGNQSTPDVAFDGLLKNWTIVPRICTQSEIQAHMNGVTPSDATRIFKMNEGAGSILYDSSANAVNGTITSGTWVADTPTKNRQAIGVNMVVNGDFSLIPPTNVAHTANSATWLDGSSSGSATNNLFGWGKLASTITGSHTAIFDTSEKRSGVASLKVSLTAPLSNVTVASTLTTTQAGMASCIPVLPSTSYSYSVWMKTNLVSGSALTGAYASFSERTSSGTMVIQNNTPNQLTTTGWTRYSGSFTTSPTTSYIMPKAVVTGNEAAGTLIMDAWFDDFTLVPTYPVSRTTVQDMNASLSLRASTSKVNCGVDVIGVGDVTVMGWVKAYSLGSSSAGRIITNGVFYVYMFANNVYRVSSNGGGTVAVTANEAMPKGKWHHLAVTRTASGVVNIRVNSSISGSPNQPSGTPSAAITNMFIGNQSTLTLPSMVF